MEYEEFKNCVVDNVRRELQGKGKIEVHSVLKNNNRKLDGLIVLRDGSSIAPALYLNEYYREYQDGCPLGNIVGEIADFYKSGKDDTQGINVDFYSSYQEVKEHIFLKLINYERNKALLGEVPHVRIMDLAAVFYCRMHHDKMGDLLIQVYHSHAKLWETDTQELYATALKNSRSKLPMELKSMNDMMNELIMQDPSDAARQDFDEPLVDDHMYVLTNYLRQFGAAVMLYQGVLSRFAMAIGGDFYILPSSVHEVILLPVKAQYEKEKLQELVEHVNRTEVAEEDFLSNTVYLYAKRLRKIIY